MYVHGFRIETQSMQWRQTSAPKILMEPKRIAPIQYFKCRLNREVKADLHLGPLHVEIIKFFYQRQKEITMQRSVLAAASFALFFSVFVTPSGATELRMSTPVETAFNVPAPHRLDGDNFIILASSKSCTKSDGTTSSCEKTCNAGETFYGNCDTNGNATCECRAN